jgi:hypothetical protein
VGPGGQNHATLPRRVTPRELQVGDPRGTMPGIRPISGRGFLMDPVTVGAVLLEMVSSADERLAPGCWM